jgi:hypothetical protein
VDPDLKIFVWVVDLASGRGVISFRRGIPLPPRSIGIIGLEENREIIYVAQEVAGKILSLKNLEA